MMFLFHAHVLSTVSETVVDYVGEICVLHMHAAPREHNSQPPSVMIEIQLLIFLESKVNFFDELYHLILPFFFLVLFKLERVDVKLLFCVFFLVFEEAWYFLLSEKLVAPISDTLFFVHKILMVLSEDLLVIWNADVKLS